MKLHLHFERQVRILPRKKILFIIVEGPSDQEALGAILSRLYPSDQIYVHIVHGDITTARNVTANKIVSEVGKLVKRYADQNHFKQSDFKEIIHITDTDGAFIPEDNVVELSDFHTDEKIIYTATEIQTENVESIRRRNEQKSSNLNRLLGCSQIWTIPYRMFYMSCNLDHVLHNKLGSTDEEKEQDAYSFAKKYHKNAEAFCDFMIHSEFSVVEDYTYRSSWDYIKKDLHSLERHSNFGLYLQKSDDNSNETL